MEHKLMSNKQRKLEPHIKLYLLVAPNSPDVKTTIGFKDFGTGEEFTFGFTSLEKLKSFVKYQKKNGMFKHIPNEIRTVWYTVEEYTNNTKNKQLCLDPPNNINEVGLERNKIEVLAVLKK